MLAHELARFFIAESGDMDKKSKKRLEILRQRLEKQNRLLAFAKQQTDEADEVENVQKQIQAIKDEIEKIKNE